jgi:sulfur carrier protein ThiS
MAKLFLAPALSSRLGARERELEQPLTVDARDAAEALERLFLRFPSLRSYVCDEHGMVRRHVAVFVDGQSIRDKVRLSEPLKADSEIHIMQALSGG